MKKLISTIKLTNTKAIESAKVNFDPEVLNNDILTLKFSWSNKNTTEETLKKYTKSYLNSFENIKKGFNIINVKIIEL